jgi:hypothetical protein
VLLNEGDPESLTQIQRNQALVAYVERYGPGRLERFEYSQYPDPSFLLHLTLASEVIRLWILALKTQMFDKPFST